jgi:hypothetical protein
MVAADRKHMLYVLNPPFQDEKALKRINTF